MPKTIAFKGHKDVAERLRILHEYYEMSWPAIARLEEFQGPPGDDPIPASTLANIAETKKVPKKWRYKFNLGAVDDRPRVTVHMHNTTSGATTINRHIKDTGALRELIDKLETKWRERRERRKK